MSDVKITVGGAVETDATRRFIDAWHRAERGEIFQERHIAFESWDALASGASQTLDSRYRFPGGGRDPWLP